jgi:hypothetical protein
MAGDERVVWVDSWQLQCCGDPFAVGSTVAWWLSPTVDRDFLGTVLAAADVGRITDVQEAHFDGLDGRTVEGVVREIERVMCRYAPVGDGPLHVPVTGSAVVTAQATADGWESETGDVRFVGYLVRLEPTAG